VCVCVYVCVHVCVLMCVYVCACVRKYGALHAFVVATLCVCV